MATSTVSNIVGSGTNANGTWIQFQDGTMICTKQRSASVTFNTSYGGWFETAVATDFGDWAKPFISTPVISVTIGGQMALLESVHNVSETSAGSSYVIKPIGVTQTNVFNIIGIGRWK